MEEVIDGGTAIGSASMHKYEECGIRWMYDCVRNRKLRGLLFHMRATGPKLYNFPCISLHAEPEVQMQLRPPHLHALSFQTYFQVSYIDEKNYASASWVSEHLPCHIHGC
jgi:hypothetical protein